MRKVSFGVLRFYHPYQINLTGLFFYQTSARLLLIVSNIINANDCTYESFFKNFIQKAFITWFYIDSNFYARNIKLYFVLEKNLRLQLRLSFARHKDCFHTFETNIFRFHIQDSHLVLNRNVGSRTTCKLLKKRLFPRAT